MSANKNFSVISVDTFFAFLFAKQKWESLSDAHGFSDPLYCGPARRGSQLACKKGLGLGKGAAFQMSIS